MMYGMARDACSIYDGIISFVKLSNFVAAECSHIHDYMVYSYLPILFD